MTLRLYYGDGTTADSWNGPAWDVQFVAWPDPVVGSDFCYGRSFFFRAPWLDGQPVSADLGGLYDYLRGYPELADRPLARLRPTDLIDAGVKFGRTISSQDFRAILERVKAETDWSGQYAHRKPDRVLV